MRRGGIHFIFGGQWRPKLRWGHAEGGVRRVANSGVYHSADSEDTDKPKKSRLQETLRCWMQLEMINLELKHRIKNLFSITDSICQQTINAEGSPKEMSRAVSGKNISHRVCSRLAERHCDRRGCFR